ncbi:MAG: MarR family winged helix-turn-helix transcriptional regulator [Acidimicrobiales bacterium]|jgi:DNA-binding MarR family transcriptional regulator
MRTGPEQTAGDGERELAYALYSLVATVAKTIPRDMSPTSVAALGTLERLGPTRLTRLAALESVAQPSMTAVVSRLEADGLVERRADERDGRAVLVTLTNDGARYLQRRREAGASRLASLIATLPEADLRALLGARPALARLAADAPGSGASPPSRALPLRRRQDRQLASAQAPSALLRS